MLQHPTNTLTLYQDVISDMSEYTA